ncbi:unnamed protein product, partial [Cyprideis torosa]
VVCDICGKGFPKYSLPKHRESHLPKIIPCPQCDLLFRTEAHLEKHRRRDHESGAKILCPVCGKESKSQHNLTRHMWTHQDGRYPCNQCPKRYGAKYLLNRHLRIHAGDRRYSCPHCPKAYFQPNVLEAHMNNVHLKVRPFTCPHCPKSYPSSGARFLHIQLKHKSLTVAPSAAAAEREVSH